MMSDKKHYCNIESNLMCRKDIKYISIIPSLHLLCLSYTPLIITPFPVVTLVPLLCSHISNSVFPQFCLLHLCNPSLSPPSSLLYLILPPLLTSLAPFCFSPLSCSPLSSLPSALLFSTFEASLVSAPSNKLYI